MAEQLTYPQALEEDELLFLDPKLELLDSLIDKSLPTPLPPTPALFALGCGPSPEE